MGRGLRPAMLKPLLIRELSVLSTFEGVSSIPVIDLGPSYSASIEARKTVADQIRTACRDIGFFYVRKGVLWQCSQLQVV